MASLVEDDVAFGPENLGVETPELARRVHDALKQVGLVGFEKHETNALSGGQKQRVAIAGVLGMEPKILILDEASAMLDPRGRKGLMRVCRELNGRGMTVVMITHFMEEAAAADRVVVLDRGKVACNGAPRDVLVRTDVLAGLNLEVPFALSLIHILMAVGSLRWMKPVRNVRNRCDPRRITIIGGPHTNASISVMSWTMSIGNLFSAGESPSRSAVAEKDSTDCPGSPGNPMRSRFGMGAFAH